ncbi:hypothetical protein [Xenorhabdus bovienii]|uniref:hypothetical protein n=1 Tax=Xenorhabdus bovienii TaxID=40576 RepID=UPI0004D7612E|nr:hypothetical protein [Xenorhabdus bovienii]CDG87327.1 conserved hypothetical protein [Xenorhabdus bovienii str. feltiae France]CDG94016.1 conserved hypothetical protein [Xenorhabdus bovienii str. feltiae Florida]
MNILNEIPEKMTFSSSGSPVEPELRAIWRISLIVIILKKLCRGSSASQKKIQVLYSILSSSDKMGSYSKYGINAELNIRFDPLLDRAISIGLGEKLLEMDEAKSIRLTKKGNHLSEMIYSAESIFTLEKEFIGLYKKSEFTVVYSTC